jgi:hypothetical protein
MPIDTIKTRLVMNGQNRFDKNQPILINFCGDNTSADYIVNDLENTPHAFVLGPGPIKALA